MTVTWRLNITAEKLIRKIRFLDFKDLKSGLTENAGRKNGGASKLQGMKLQDMKMTDMKMQDMNMTDQKWRQGVKLRDKKDSFNRDNIRMKCANF